MRALSAQPPGLGALPLQGDLETPGHGQSNGQTDGQTAVRKLPGSILASMSVRTPPGQPRTSSGPWPPLSCFLSSASLATKAQKALGRRKRPLSWECGHRLPPKPTASLGCPVRAWTPSACLLSLPGREGLSQHRAQPPREGGRPFHQESRTALPWPPPIPPTEQGTSPARLGPPPALPLSFLPSWLYTDLGSWEPP